MRNDREQLEKAFKALTEKGYYARSRYWCCNNCAFSDMPEEAHKKFVFWHEQDDMNAFGESDFGYLSKSDAWRIARSDGYSFEDFEYEWIESEDEWKNHNILLHPLYLSWYGDGKEIVLTLQEFGFTVEFEGNIDSIDTSVRMRILPAN